MQNTQIKCPGCGAPISNKDITEIVKCPYCGSCINIDASVLEQKRINEKAEFDKHIALEEMKLEKEETSKYNKIRKYKIIVAVALAAIALIGYIVGFSDDDYIGFLMIGMFALLGSVLCFTSLSDYKKKSSKSINPNYAEISSDLIDFEEKNYSDIAAKLRCSGFTNVNCIPLCDLNFLTQGLSGKVDSITVNGEKIEEEDYYPKDSIIVINYHSKN